MFTFQRKFLGLLFLATFSTHASTLLTESFNDITTLAGAGWTLTNNSSPIGTTNWFQGNTSVFSSNDGAANAYIAANFDNADFGGDISNWLISPLLALDSSTVLSFYTRGDNLLPDNLEVRLSTNGASSNVGGTATSVGDFSTLLLSVNPALTTSYPTTWTQYSLTLSGVVVPTNGRLAFRYVVPDTSTNGDYIGIDTVSVTSGGAAGVPEPSTLFLAGLGFGAAFLPKFRRRKRA